MQQLSESAAAEQEGRVGVGRGATISVNYCWMLSLYIALAVSAEQGWKGGGGRKGEEVQQSVDD